MKIRSLLVVLLAAALTGCTGTVFSPSQTSAVKQAVDNPNSIAKVTQDGVAAGATAFLGRNPKYKAELVAVADGLIGLSQGNPSMVSAPDFASVLSNTSLSTAEQNEISAVFTTALGIFQSDFQVNFPTLNPGYSIYVDAVANGLYVATGNGTKVVTLPVIPWPPVTTATAPAVAPAPTPTPTPAPTS